MASSTVFSPTPAELTVVSQIFAQHDPQKLGILTGDVAVRVFGGAKLAPTTLGEIWNIADEDNNGWLPKKGVAIAVRLIGWAQKGDKISPALVNKPGPLAVIEGITAISQQNTGISLPKSPPPFGAAFPPLTQQDKARFYNMFVKSGPVSGLLSGDKARDVFIKSKLSNEQLLKIWNLADTQDRGSLDSVDFAIGMYFIQGAMTGKISFIPTTLPPGLYQQAGGSGPSPSSIRTHTTGTSGSFSPVNSTFAPQLTGQLTGQSPMLQPDVTGMSSAFNAPALPARPHTNGHGALTNEWDVTPTEKASADRFFDTLDTGKKGYIEGDVAVPFMLKSQLPGETLAQVWDLADLNNDGRLTRDGFAVAMHLIQKKLAGQEVPAALPSSLIPPSLRGSAIGASPFSPVGQQVHTQPEPVDLFSFDDTPPPSAVQTQPTPVARQHTGAGVLKPQATGGYPQPPSIQRPPANDPFTASFQPQPTSAPHHDLLGDDDHGASSHAIHDQSAEIGNVRNQLQSTEKSVAAAKQERQTLEQALAEQASQLSSLQTQLSVAKASFETETSLLATLKERRAAQVAEIQKTREELIRSESDLSAVRVEKAEIEGAFLRDKEDARDLHRKMVEAGQQADALKADVEKLKKEAKQQKGLLAIARKQLSTKEGEKAKAEKEHQEATAELTTLAEETSAVEAEIASLDAVSPAAKNSGVLSPATESVIFAAAQPLPATPDIPPAPVRNNSNNPFALAMGSEASGSRSQSPFLSGVLSSPPASINGTVPVTTDVPAESAQEEPKPVEAKEVPAAVAASPLFLDDASSDHAHGLDGIFSPGTDHFVTPPTSAQDPTFPDPAAKFPSLDEMAASTAPTTKEEKRQTLGPTDLNSQLKELEPEESDSDSDDDEPLAHAAATLPTTNGKVPPPIPANESAPPVEAPAAATTFDDIFGDSEPTKSEPAPELAVTATPFDAFNPPAAVDTPAGTTSPPTKEAEPAPHVAGVDEFDQAMGKVPSTNAAPAPVNFSFDDAFEDSFDFNSAKVAFPAVDAPANREVAGTDAFDAAFGTPAAPPAPSPAPPQSNGAFDTSFDAVFGGSGPSLAPAPVPVLAPAAPIVPAAPSAVVQPHPAQVPSEQSIPGAFPPQRPVSRPQQPVSPQQRPVSSPRPKTPPRAASPKPRLSSSSSKEAEKPKDPPPRHSKLSIRLPFGKKKKHAEPMPPPPSHSSHLAPPLEAPERLPSPAIDDDVEAVKQLTAMGFSRSQAVAALEKYGYDVQRALNSLIGQ